MRDFLEDFLERLIFASRWLLAPIYIVLCLSLLFITVKVIGARSTSMAKNIGFSIANSPLFKTAVAGEDPNWGRIVMAIGKSRENVIPNKIQIKIGVQ